jgi:DNA-binding transcriptional ArsR family regulator
MTGKWGRTRAIFSRGSPFPWLVLLVCSMVLVSQGATASDFEEPESQQEEIEMGLPLHLSGLLQTTGESGAYQMGPLPEDAIEFAFWLEAGSMELRLTNITMESLLGTPHAEQVTPSRETRPVTSQHGPFYGSTIRLAEALQGFYLLAHAEQEQARFWTESLSTNAVLDNIESGTRLSFEDEPGLNHHNYRLTSDMLSFSTFDPFTEITGDFTVVLFGTSFTVDHVHGRESFDTGRSSSHALTTALPFGTPLEPLKQSHTQFAVLEVKDARLALRAIGPEGQQVTPYSSTTVEVDGAVEAPALLGSFQMNGEKVQISGDPARMEGQFTMNPKSHSGQDKAVFAVDGSVEKLTVGTQQFRADNTMTQAAGIALLLTGAGAAVWQVAKSGLLVPLYAKLTRRKVLDQSTRQQVHDKIHSDPGCTTRSVAKALGISWSTAAYHLRVLRHMGMITSKRQGRHEHFFVTGESSQVEQVVKAVLQNPTTRKIANLIAMNPGIIQKDVCEQLKIAPSTASDHLKRLREAGAVREERQWRTRAYHPAPVLLQETVSTASMENYTAPVASAGTTA